VSSIGSKLFFIIGLIIIIFSSFILYRTYNISNRHVNEIVETHAEMALQFDLSIRKYIAEKVRPIMYDLVGEEEFIPESMSTSFVAHSIFEDVKEQFPGYVLKFSSDDPRNPANQAGPEELEIIDYFNSNPQENRWSGLIMIGNKQYYARFNARRMRESCLRCHGNPEDAPRSLLERYGSTAGFHRPVGEVIALDTIAIPISSVQEQLREEVKNNFIIIGVGITLMFAALFVSVKFYITKRLASITKHFADASSEEDYRHIQPIDEGRYKDEISILAKSYNSLAGKLNKYHESLDQEIQERRKTEEKLQESKQTLENVLNNSRPICITNTEFEIILANKAYYAIWPESEEREKVKCYESRPGSHCKSDLCPLKQIVGGKEEVTVDATKYTSEGDEYVFIITARPFRDPDGNLVGIVESFQDISERKKLEDEKAKLIDELQASLEKVKLLSGFLPICASCKKVRDDKGYWSQIESYISDHSEAEFSHGICPECEKKYYDELNDMLDN
jgi:PAS domain S-box-containing protein